MQGTMSLKVTLTSKLARFLSFSITDTEKLIMYYNTLQVLQKKQRLLGAEIQTVPFIFGYLFHTKKEEAWEMESTRLR